MRAPFLGAPKASLTSKALTACAAATLALGLGVGTASALPPGGAKASTPGTSSTVSSSVSEHGVISFSVSGFPANAVVSVKVDDGNLCPSNAAQGACVVHQQKTDGNGKVSGSFVLPDVGPGTHTLRFLASGEKRDKDGKYLGTEAYSNRSPEFTVVGEGGSDNSSSNRGSSSSKSKGGSSNGGSNSNSSDSADNAQGSNDSNESSSNGGSNDSSIGSAGGAADAETVYTDADGNTITKEEYDRLNAESDSSGTSDSSAASAASDSANAQKKAAASASASSSAAARGAVSKPSASASGAANTASTVQTVTYGAAFPWVGVVVLGVSIVGAAALLLIRKR
ncbi:plasmid partitioning protein [Rothia sp. P3C3.S176]|uniref:plasmid partitioning protein n=1 Tax=Rothia sp. P3C3.S176 TaxID=2962204 RepID=UPI0020C894B8|nr:plasmid partitioning protein [Rothia sp. P3C3.S176]MCP8995241.1 plasmid partitioning protein [Rothia sp. P3C3.S176]